MDGVLADFFSGLEERFNVKHWKQIPKTEESIMGLKGTDFFNQLKPYPTTMELVNFVQTLVGDDKWGICSSPLRGDRDNSAYWKRVWLTRHGFLPPIDKLIFTGQKERFATERFSGVPNILVDDKPDNISRWISKGGIGILYQANECTFEYVKEEIENALRRQ
jgi:hypothetical protein